MIRAGPQAEERRGVVARVHCMPTQTKVRKIINCVGLPIPFPHGHGRTLLWS